MTELEKLYGKLYSNNVPRASKPYVDIYEENKNLIEGADHSTSNPEYDYILRFTADYALSLSHYGSSRKAIPYLDKAIQLFKDSSVDDLTKVPIYESLVFTRGSENYNQKKFNVATKDFQYLVDTYPDNDVYKKWLIAARTYNSKKYMKYVDGFALVCFLWYALATKDGDKNRDYFLMAGIVTVLIELGMRIINSLIKSSIMNK